MVDQGDFDRSLKGYFLPEGFKLEVVIDAPDTVNPVGMTFGPDGTLYLMEWRPDPVSGDRDTAVLSAVYGLGEGLVSGELDADTYRVRFVGGCPTGVASARRSSS